MDIGTFISEYLIICFTVTSLTIRIYPISKLANTYFEGKKPLEEISNENIFKFAFNEGLKSAANSKPLFKNLCENLIGGIKMCLVLTPAVTSIGMLALLLVKMTPVFDIIGYIFYPLTFLLSFIGLENPLAGCKASSTK